MHRHALVLSPLIGFALFTTPLAALGAQVETSKPPAGRRTLPTPVARQLPDGRIEVQWPAVEGATKYQLSRSVPPVPEAMLSQPNPTDTVYLDSDVKAGSYYYYVVAAIDGNGQRGIKRGSVPVKAIISAGAGGPPPGPVAGADSGAGAPSATDTATAPDTTAPEARNAMLERAYTDGGQRFAHYKAADKKMWLALADTSGMTYDELVKSWAGIFFVGYAFKHLLERPPRAEEVKRHSLNISGVSNWQSFWREIATSPERDEKFGSWAPVPFHSREAAQRAFGRKSPTGPEQCFGGMGDKCEGGIPQYPEVQPRWLNRFTLPHGTQMGFVSIGVAVGSILHDNACIQNRDGLNCNGIGPGDLIKTGDGPAALEWNKAAWNLLDTRNWRARFGPYPLDKRARREGSFGEGWYDDLRPVSSRESWMASALGMVTIPVQSIRYTGGETKASRRLKAPPNTTLDRKDKAFCASGQFAHTETPPMKSPSGTCR